jgi:acetyltransferase-like isoleucine patch superfamily enzyme
MGAAVQDPRGAYPPPHSHTHPPPPSPPRPRSAKDDMLSGRMFSPFDKELSWERDRCSAAVWRFNNCMNPSFGISIHEKMRLFREIVFPRDHSPFPSAAVSQSRGFLGDHVTVDAPFTCEYGYNLFIGRNVVIGRNCTIMDAGEVRINDNCRIGPNVSILTSTHPEDPKLRRDLSCPTAAQGVVIQEDCFIGGGVTILGGKTIGRGSIVGAGSVVTKDVPPYTVVAGSPAKVIRGVNTHSEDQSR